ncbi:helix-turn-helix domain-containing protein [Flavobacterium sp. FlaQc-51]|uniref:helix-turn-helix domain-containing protein n=1 Tax=Flavobacterium sp. FlaQc-51 TaxID=3374184 RepID=UPI003757AAD3
MSKKATFIPVHSLSKESEEDFVVKQITPDNLNTLNETEHAHRHDYHIFSLVRKGTFHIEIDFERYQIKAPAVLYIHPSQIHRILKIEKADVFLLGVNSDKLNPDYLRILEQIIESARSLPLKSAIYTILDQAIILCTTLFERKTDKLYASVLKDYCNAFVGLIVSQYLEQMERIDSLSRYQILTKEFKLLLERDFILIKQPSDYAGALNISTSYLNECVRNATGLPVSHHIHLRIILEAKRLLFYSDKSVKEIAAELGYDDYPYFCRIFAKITGTTAMDFRNKITH